MLEDKTKKINEVLYDIIIITVAKMIHRDVSLMRKIVNLLLERFIIDAEMNSFAPV